MLVKMYIELCAHQIWSGETGIVTLESIFGRRPTQTGQENFHTLVAYINGYVNSGELHDWTCVKEMKSSEDLSHFHYYPNVTQIRKKPDNPSFLFPYLSPEEAQFYVLSISVNSPEFKVIPWFCNKTGLIKVHINGSLEPEWGADR